MSYILDALRKSEQERLRGQPLSTLSHAPIGSDGPARPRWLLPLLAGNLVLGTVLAVWWLRSAATDAPQAPAPEATVLAAPAATAAAPTPPAAPQPTLPSARQDAGLPTAAEDEYVPLPEPALPNAAYERAGDWQADSADGWPTLALSTHVYSSAPDARNVIINGMRLKEGDTLDSGVKIEEITETGARVSWRGNERELDITR
jgi:hypothetical protein